LKGTHADAELASNSADTHPALVETQRIVKLLRRQFNGHVFNRDAPWWDVPFPSLDNLHKACRAIGSTRDMTTGIETSFLAVKDDLKIVLDPLTQPLSWILNGSLHVFGLIPWWVLIPAR
jgi:hypothetical protein